jgi:hypothetical protein
VFTPALASGVANAAVVTFLPQKLDIKVGDGNATYTENVNREYLRDRGTLDTVRNGDEEPLSLSIEMVYESITTGTAEDVAPLDALKGIKAASEWVSSAADLCEPYAIDVQIAHDVPCGTKQDETLLFPDFRFESAAVDIKAATISVDGKCNATEPTVTRS